MTDVGNKTIVLAAGGTGGHIFPAEALSEVLCERGYHVVLLTDKRCLDYGVKHVPEVQVIQSSGLGGGLWKQLSGAVKLALGCLQARSRLRKLHPAVVVGFGGYPAFPTLWAALRGGYKTVIHEQNCLLGKVNYIFAPKVDVIATSFPEVSRLQENMVKKVVLTGNPVRHAIKALRKIPYPDIVEDGILRILVTGGSQGASIFSEVLPVTLEMLSPELRKRIRIDQQCREEDIEKVRTAYAGLSVSADLATFFNDIPTRLAAAHLVIARAGASTLAEIAVAGRPTIMVPYPHASDNHQMVNANALEDAGGGWVMPQESFTPEALSARLKAFLELPYTLREAAEKMQKAGISDADKQLADLVEGLAQQESA